ncbi:MAG: hypothetical protein JSW04_07670 [Desulfobacterales bacterium]|nr:MAG: hypothetical protein JSV38_08670 [Desulfobacterales bacterium]UCD91284.1 MAG: hypothetical protein JSW04_07670 [Desulfobacterales bacterium]
MKYSNIKLFKKNDNLSGIGIGSDDVLHQLEDGVMGLLGLEQKNISEIVLDVIESNNKIV